MVEVAYERLNEVDRNLYRGPLVLEETEMKPIVLGNEENPQTVTKWRWVCADDDGLYITDHHFSINEIHGSGMTPVQRIATTEKEVKV